jgi:hypothetical protein
MDFETAKSGEQKIRVSSAAWFSATCLAGGASSEVGKGIEF